MTLAVLRGGGTASYQIEEEETQVVKHLGVFGATLVTFFLAEMGDKTQIATVAMAAHFPNPVMVVIGTTLGMLIADVPAVFVGDRFSKRASHEAGALHRGGDVRGDGCAGPVEDRCLNQESTRLFRTSLQG